MGNLGESMQQMLSTLAERFGIRGSEEQRLRGVREQLESEKRRCADNLDDLKDEIRRLEARAVGKKHELDATRGEGRRIITREIEQTLRERTMLREKEALLFSRKDKVTVLLRKMELAAPAQAAPALDLEGMADEAADLMEDLVKGEAKADKAVGDLEQIRYEEPPRRELDVETELRRVQGATEESSELSQDLLDELAQLEPPEEE